MKVKTDAKKPRGRPPTHAILVDGQWQLTEESFELAAQRLVRYRRRAQQRYQELQKVMRQQHPELFKQRAHQQQTLVAARSNGESEDLFINKNQQAAQLDQRRQQRSHERLLTVALCSCRLNQRQRPWRSLALTP